ncbi:MAG: choice-of-anchor Q domain-containing protein [Paludibacter sp.]|nr:choice-of-anchor Q domain-containing protein [Paludibacter sp.]
MKKFLLFISLILTLSVSAQTTYYVSKTGLSSNDGLSWATAKNFLKNALPLAVDGDIIKVGQGSYVDGNETVVTKSVTIKGGYDPETDTQDLTKPSELTRLSGNGRIMVFETVDKILNLDNLIFSTANADAGGALRANFPSLQTVAQLNITNCRFINNKSFGSFGAAIMAMRVPVKLTNTIFSGNNTKSSGGVFLKYGAVEVNNCLFYNNTSEDDAAALYYYGTSLKITNSTFANNTGTNAALAQGGALGLYSDANITSNVEINNSIFWGNTAAKESNQIYVFNDIQALLTRNIIEGGRTGIVVGARSAINYSTSALSDAAESNPLFVDAAGNDFRLTSTSPAVNAGDNTKASGITLDLDRTARINSAVVDLGAYEFLFHYFTGTGPWTDVTRWDTGTLPNASSDVFIDGEATIESNVEVTSLTVNNGKALTLSPSAQLTVSEALTNNGTLTLQSNSSGTATLVTNGTVTGTNYMVEQYLPSQRNWYMSSPVASAVRPLRADYPNVEYYDETVTDFSNTALRWVDIADAATLTVGKGYVVYPNASVPKTLTFTGNLNTGDKSVILSRTDSKTSEIGFNLVGNPYPSYLNIDNLQSNPDIEKTYWYRSQNVSGTYVFDTYNIPSGIQTGLSGKTVSKFIPPMQAFWLRVSEGKTSATVDFLNANRGHKDAPNNLFRAPKAANATNQIFRLTLSNSTAITDEAVIYFNANAVDAYDSYDSPKMMNNGTTYPNIYTTVGPENAVLNGMSAIPYDVLIPLAVQGNAGNYTITSKEFSNFGANDKVYLFDGSSSDYIDFTNGGSYSFDLATSGVSSDRFSVIFTRSGVPTSSNNIDMKGVNIFTSNNRIVVSADESNFGKTVYVYNVLGRLIANQTVTGVLNQIEAQLQPGTYIVKLNSNTSKVIIK